MSESLAFIAECDAVLTAWAERHEHHGIDRVEMAEPVPGDDPGTPWRAYIWVVEKYDLAYLAEPCEDGWRVLLAGEFCCHIGTAPTLLDALQLIRRDDPRVLRKLRTVRAQALTAA